MFDDIVIDFWTSWNFAMILIFTLGFRRELVLVPSICNFFVFFLSFMTSIFFGSNKAKNKKNIWRGRGRGRRRYLHTWTCWAWFVRLKEWLFGLCFCTRFRRDGLKAFTTSSTTIFFFFPNFSEQNSFSGLQRTQCFSKTKCFSHILLLFNSNNIIWFFATGKTCKTLKNHIHRPSSREY